MANRTQFARQYRAVDFNYGGLGPDVPPALVVATAPGVSGSQTLTVYGGSVTLTDGTIVSVLNTNAPVSVINASGTDTQTPSAVSTYVQSNIYGATGTVTGTWTYAHYQGDRVASGTVGLQEAINYCNTKGGGTVIIDSDWVAQGGTTTILNAVTLPAGVMILDNRTGNPSASITVTATLTNAQILALNSTPIQLVGAYGSGTLIIVNSMILENLNTGTAYTSGGAIGAYYGTTNQTYPASATVASTFLTSPTAKALAICGPGFADDLAADCLNAAVSISNASGNFATGTGTLKVILNYTVVAGL